MFTSTCRNVDQTLKTFQLFVKAGVLYLQSLYEKTVKSILCIHLYVAILLYSPNELLLTSQS